MALCAVCEVKAECLQYALDAGERIGVYGGTTGADRRRLRAIGGVSRVRR